jgi:hypothetical protein
MFQSGLRMVNYQAAASRSSSATTNVRVTWEVSLPVSQGGPILTVVRSSQSGITKMFNTGTKIMNRRAFLAGTAATATAVTLQGAMSATEGPLGSTGVPLSSTEPLPLGALSGSRYPDPHIEVLDKRFKGSPGTGAVERLATGFRWAEGPAYFPAGRYLLFSDIPNNRIMRLSEDDNHLSVFRYPSFNSNGNTIDREGRLITCEHGGRRVTRTEIDGSITIIADKYNGKRLNSPNDVAVASDGSIWFTDPIYGIGGNYEGIREQAEQEKHSSGENVMPLGSTKSSTTSIASTLNPVISKSWRRSSMSSTQASPMVPTTRPISGPSTSM